MAKKTLLPCLKACMFHEDRKSHKKHERTAKGRAWLETKAHTDELLTKCVGRCHKAPRKRR
jgi:hypothetical protein